MSKSIIPLKDCPRCDGKGYYQELVVFYGVPGGGDGPIYDCGLCNGKGKVPYDMYLAYKGKTSIIWTLDFEQMFGGYLKQ